MASHPRIDAGAWRLAMQPAVVRRALGFAIGVGFVLIAINHGDAILAGDVGARRWWKIGLTMLVPYCVSTASSVMASRQTSARAGDAQ